ncbi:substrate-binding and VWA domain-containing protein [Streptomyces sp. NBC_01795]|uniref:substrate-binding and VWA domain-containing protein n=1 Tax=unclassified Streptomyces TaxID=2593676 RepID=UPI002DD8538E|nr:MULTISPECIES: substrate-binding and VWA domain-containing protein [unclassified Streptomyces]WSA96557.1 substrate-binding and VWA domain-containing protein [Streptomyces sp. NBC_01795]WSB80972.1 substrate-binding and VWA domain-containing protein [Streptomyces sp. NBC_01775]WSS10819.1 substrate-binding and VWA domain-containing protein [Streptomyces sp. NBC_01186]
MPRHSLPDNPGPHGARGPRALEHSKRSGARRRPESRGRSRRRKVTLATALVLVLGAGTFVAARSGMLPFGGDCDGSSVEVRVAASPEIAPALRRVADEARESETKSDGRCLNVHVSERTGAEVADTLQRGGKGANVDYDVWLPDSRIWVDRAATSGRAPSLDPLGNVASSPLTLAAVPSAARRMGWPGKAYSWSRIASATTGDNDLRIGSADPSRSATGLLALTRIREATVKEGGKDSGTEAAAAAKQLAERTAPGDSQVLATLPRDNSGAELGNPQRNQALVLSEQAAFAHNRSRGDTPGLRLFYPDTSKNGSTALDYPYTLVNSKKLGTTTSRAALRFQTLLGGSKGKRALAAHGFRPAGGQAGESLARRAGARAPQPYTATPGEPPSADNVRAALGMWTITVQSARFTLVVDSSASMAAPVPGRDGQSRMDVSKASLIRGLSQFTPQDEVGLWEFSTRLKGKKDYRELVPPDRLGDRDDDGVTQRDRLTGAFGKMKPIPGGATGLYDTALAASREARRGYAQGRFNAVVLLTDGANEDPGSISRQELVTELEEMGDGKPPVPLIAIAVGPDADEKSAKEIAKATGGSAHQVNDPAQIHAVILKAVMEAGSRS